MVINCLHEALCSVCTSSWSERCDNLRGGKQLARSCGSACAIPTELDQQILTKDLSGTSPT